jgi:hypothetical protein
MSNIFRHTPLHLHFCPIENIVLNLPYFVESPILFTETLKTFVKIIFALIIAHLYPPTRHTNGYIRRSLALYCPYVLPAAEVTACPQLIKFFRTAKIQPALTVYKKYHPKTGDILFLISKSLLSLPSRLFRM